jgi:hypothetical protein
MLTIKRKNMKKNILSMAFVLAAVMLFTSCGKTYIEENQDNYSPADVIPVVLSVAGPSEGLQTFTYDFSINYSRSGSTWNWSATDATVKTVSADTRTASILLDKFPASGIAYVKVTETTAGGVTSPEKSLPVTVKKFCPLAGGNAELVGSWSGTDGASAGTDYVYPSIITSSLNGTALQIQGIGVGFIQDFWAEEVVSMANVTVVINPNGTLNIARQPVFTTLYDGANYNYEIIGSGTWDNCGASPALVIKYDIYYEGESTGLAAQYKSYLGGIAYLTATITLD